MKKFKPRKKKKKKYKKKRLNPLALEMRVLEARLNVLLLN